METLAIIPARGGSKRLPQKNLKMLSGKPLIFWSISAALQTEGVNRVIVSTDSDEIAEVAVRYGADVPFLRPSNLAMDTTPDFPVFHHAVEYLNQHEGYKPDIIIWLRPTVPLRTCDDIKLALEILVQTNASSVRSVAEAERHPYWMKQIENQLLLSLIPGKDEITYYQHQLLPPVYYLNGAVDITWRQKALESHTLFSSPVAAYVMPHERSIDIDTQLDLTIAEILMNKKEIPNAN